ncbi:MAG: energy transducer TonB [Planctomycetota bacterium]
MNSLRLTLPVSLGLHLAPFLVFASATPTTDLEIQMGEVAVEVEWVPEPLPELPPAPPEVVPEEPDDFLIPEEVVPPEPPPEPPPVPVEDEGLVEARQVEGNVPPTYPGLARRRGQEGRVLVHVVVGEDGVVSSATVRESSGLSYFDEAALKAIRGWKFTPGRRWGKSVSSELLIPIEFKITDKDRKP